jgi:DNA repair photolyase
MANKKGRSSIKGEIEAGRPSMLTKETHDKIVYAVGKGATYLLAAEYARISKETLRRWKAWGEQFESEFIDEKMDSMTAEEKKTYLEEISQLERYKYYALCVSLREARATDALALLDRIDAACAEAKGWGAAAWKLERVHSYTEKRVVESNIELNGKVANFNADMTNMTEEQAVNLYKDFLNSLSSQEGDL